jgi:hypothetical protein
MKKLISIWLLFGIFNILLGQFAIMAFSGKTVWTEFSLYVYLKLIAYGPILLIQILLEHLGG